MVPRNAPRPDPRHGRMGAVAREREQDRRAAGRRAERSPAREIRDVVR